MRRRRDNAVVVTIVATAKDIREGPGSQQQHPDLLSYSSCERQESLGKTASPHVRTSYSSSTTTMPLRLAVFDLDFTVWSPEMYQLWGPPTLSSIDKHEDLDPQVLKEARTSEKNMILTDRSDTPITIFEGA